MLRITGCQKSVKLTKNQSKLFFCLLNEIQEKKDIIHYIWGGENQDDSAYRQLVRRTRKLLSDKGFPEETIMTISHYGLCINNEIFNIKKTPDLLPGCIHNTNNTRKITEPDDLNIGDFISSTSVALKR